MLDFKALSSFVLNSQVVFRASQEEDTPLFYLEWVTCISELLSTAQLSWTTNEIKKKKKKG